MAVLPIPAAIHLPVWINGESILTEKRLEVRHPFNGQLVGTVSVVDPEHAETAIVSGLVDRPALSHYQRFEILDRARVLLQERRDEFALLIAAESGLCLKETNYEVGRSLEVLRLAGIECLKDEGQSFSGDISAQGQNRKIFTVREPLRLALAITPFNHPLNQVVHKVAPAIAAGTPLILKPSERTPLTALKFVELLYEAGLPGHLLQAVIGPVDSVLEPMIRDPRIELVTFTGSVSIGKRIANIAGYKKLCLELGGNSPLIVLEDCDMDLAVHLAAEGSYRNSGQRCTAVKRLLIHERRLSEFTERFVEESKKYLCGNPFDTDTRVGTVITEDSAKHLQGVVVKAVEQGAKVLLGGHREGALLQPTVIANVPRDAEMVVQESFGPLAPILSIRDVDDAIQLANGTAYGLSTGVVTNNLNHALKVIKGVRTGTVNVNQVPGYRIESTPFGGVKDSGLGIKEGVVEAIRFMTMTKTWSIPW
ncbi:aldehyde dehydrogenase family protein [Planctomicrobium sp. SH527]|uniref:aldehyde dehydrogenase family protein n=1 Tax=Planctomicrobium sp. SH527 TaxID=3448123 RepID=UPI003F5B8F15